MNKEDILIEIHKENPDWLLISNIAKSIYESTKKVGPLGFLSDHINIVKASEWNLNDIKKELESCIPDAEYIIIGGCLSLHDFNKKLPSLRDKFVIVLTDKPQVLANTIKASIPFRQFNCAILNKYSSVKKTQIHLKGEGLDIKTEIGSLKSKVRDLTLKNVLEP